MFDKKTFNDTTTIVVTGNKDENITHMSDLMYKYENKIKDYKFKDIEYIINDTTGVVYKKEKLESLKNIIEKLSDKCLFTIHRKFENDNELTLILETSSLVKENIYFDIELGKKRIKIKCYELERIYHMYNYFEEISNNFDKDRFIKYFLGSRAYI